MLSNASRGFRGVQVNNIWWLSENGYVVSHRCLLYFCISVWRDVLWTSWKFCMTRRHVSDICAKREPLFPKAFGARELCWDARDAGVTLNSSILRFVKKQAVKSVLQQTKSSTQLLQCCAVLTSYRRERCRRLHLWNGIARWSQCTAETAVRV